MIEERVVMGLKWKPRVRRVVILLAVAMVAPGLAIGDFIWTGDDENDNNRTSEDNWQSFGGYPGEGGDQTDSITMDDTNPRTTMVQDTADLTVRSMFIGDGHTVQLDNNIDVLYPQATPDVGRLEFEGAVDLKGANNKEIEADYIIIYTTQQTTVTFEADSGSQGKVITNNN